DASELLNIFVQGSDQLFGVSAQLPAASVVLGQPSVLAEQPEFASGESMRRLLALTEGPHALGDLLRHRSGRPGITITIGGEHQDLRFANMTVVTAEYSLGALAGVIGVI